MIRIYGAYAAALSRLRAANSITALTCSRSRPSNHSMMSSIFAPASRFSKMEDTGIRVPFKTHAPLSLPGTLSTAEHWDQSRAAIPLIVSFFCPPASPRTTADRLQLPPSLRVLRSQSQRLPILPNRLLPPPHRRQHFGQIQM